MLFTQEASYLFFLVSADVLSGVVQVFRGNWRHFMQVSLYEQNPLHMCMYI